MPVGFTTHRSVQVPGFGEFGHLTPARRLVSASCSSGQPFASGFLQIRGHLRHPCLWLTLPLAGCGGLSPPSHHQGHHSQAGCACAQRAIAWCTHKKGPHVGGPKNCIKGVMSWRFTSIRCESRTSCIHPRQLTRIRERYIIDFIDN